MEIRKATHKDFETLCEFFNGINDTEAKLTSIIAPAKDQRDAIRKEAKEYLEDLNRTVFIAEENGKAIGTITAKYNPAVRQKFTRRKLGVLQQVFVAEKYRKKGVATKLIETAKDFLREKGVNWFEANLVVTNTASFNTLKKSGFKPYAYIMHCYE